MFTEWPIVCFSPVTALAILACSAASSLAHPPSHVSPKQTADGESRRDHLWALAKSLDEQGKLAEAVAPAQQAIAIERTLEGDAREPLADSLTWIASRLEKLRRFTEARDARREVVRIKSTARGPDDWRTIDARIALAHTDRLADFSVQQLKQLDEASKLLEQYQESYASGRPGKAIIPAQRALRLHEQVLGADDPVTAGSLNCVAAMHSLLGDYEKAKTLYERAMDVNQKTCGEQHPVYARVLDNLAQLHYRRGEQEEAGRLFVQAMAIREATLGVESDAYAASLNNLARLYQTQGRYAEAERMLQDSAHVFSKLYGESSPKRATALQNLAYLYRTLRRYDHAIDMHTQVREIRRAAQKKPGVRRRASATARTVDIQYRTLWRNELEGDRRASRPRSRGATKYAEPRPS